MVAWKSSGSTALMFFHLCYALSAAHDSENPRNAVYPSIPFNIQDRLKMKNWGLELFVLGPSICFTEWDK